MLLELNVVTMKISGEVAFYENTVVDLAVSSFVDASVGPDVVISVNQLV